MRSKKHFRPNLISSAVIAKVSLRKRRKVPGMLAMLALLGHDPHLGAEFSLVSNPRTSWVGRLPRVLLLYCLNIAGIVYVLQ